MAIGLACFLVSIPAFADGQFAQAPQLLVSMLALAVAYLACWYTAEKLRLDLLDRRFEIYRDVLTFCSVVTQHGTLRADENNREEIAKAILAAEGSFRGIGIHKSRALFGSDIHEFLNGVNRNFACIIAFQDDDSKIDEYYASVMAVWDAIGVLPDKFKPYVYFGDYRLPQ